MKTLEFAITEKNYNNAVESNSGGCLVADAIKEAYPNLSAIKVNVATISVSDKEAGERYIFLTPQTAAEALLFFDQGWKEEKFPINMRARTLVKVVPIIKSPKTAKLEAEQRATLLAELESKLEKGEELTGEQKRSLTRIRNRKPGPVRPSTRGPVTVDDSGTIHGGKLLTGKNKRYGKTHPNMLAGKDRHFGQKSAIPGRAFREAVDKAAHEEAEAIVAQKLQGQLFEEPGEK